MSSAVTLALGIVIEAEVGIEEVLEVASFLADVVETGGAMTEVLVPLEVTPELTDVSEAGVASMALLTEDFDLVIVRKSEENNLKCKTWRLSSSLKWICFNYRHNDNCKIYALYRMFS